MNSKLSKSNAMELLRFYFCAQRILCEEVMCLRDFCFAALLNSFVVWRNRNRIEALGGGSSESRKYRARAHMVRCGENLIPKSWLYFQFNFFFACSHRALARYNYIWTGIWKIMQMCDCAPDGGHSGTNFNIYLWRLKTETYLNLKRKSWYLKQL